jgi:hypothetical protein
VRGSNKRRSKRPPLTLTLSPFRRGMGRGEYEAARYVARVVSAGVPASVGSAADASVSAGSP